MIEIFRTNAKLLLGAFDRGGHCHCVPSESPSTVGGGVVVVIEPREIEAYQRSSRFIRTIGIHTLILPQNKWREIFGGRNLLTHHAPMADDDGR